MVHDGQRHEHHRGVGGGARRLARVRDLDLRRGAAPARRAPLHDGPGGRRRRRRSRRRDPEEPGWPEPTPATPDPPPRPLDRDLGLQRPEPRRGDHRRRRSPVAGIRRGQRRDRRAVPGRGPGPGRRARGASPSARIRHPCAGRGVRHDGRGHGAGRAADAQGERGSGEYSGEARGKNIIAASIEAYVMALNAMLGEAHWEGAPEAAAAPGSGPGRRRR